MSRYRKRKNVPIKKLLINITVIAVLFAVSFLLNTYYGFLPKSGCSPVFNKGDEELMVHFVDVGQGDCSILQLPDGKNMIIDGGPPSAKSKVLQYINYYKITRFDYMVLSHPHDDHYGSLTDVLTDIEVSAVYMSDLPSDRIKTASYGKFINAVSESGAEILYSLEGEIIYGGFGLEIVFFTPDTQVYIDAAEEGFNLNELSPIIMVYYGGKSIMFTGDATSKTENLFLSAASSHSVLKNKPIQADVLKVAHHGSKYSSINKFLDKVKPEISVISAGADNSYGHPHPETVERLLSHSEQILRTDTDGDIVLKITNDGKITVLGGESENDNLKLYIQFILFIAAAHINKTLLLSITYKIN
ncbi:MAG: MBL fold metallo-hydrolase [Clostridia bacterium]|nr:MBL fold metallo-hydrolase [Clostridia bacterium]